ncbi:DUF2000 domain-containing protein [bacterium]|uniref:DUF2000 domain-containing protein n=2 Tax=Katanobacteria TaxID=422282 RepID=A0A2M7X2K4_UNCKA|nr:DUF2000 domain-containing protein [bacterium]PIP56754.1 MAG: hypothetical protein COX05_01380 [candidate division WWE3 bacterium CG22_combo_CG10-13_8_21_14_all_39_12]PJA40403.1 MAG: hypothetical protein CO179_02340 [candidate division WWE3 bacterium CG_4_9_14_3_um_filter_39_7]
MEQDFSRKITIVVDKTLPSWQVLNTIAHVSAYFGNKITEPFDTGDNFVTKDGVLLPRNSQFPIIALAAHSAEAMRNLAQKVRASENILGMYFIKEMIETTDDNELENSVSAMNETDLIYYGVGLFGKNEVVKELTKNFKLWS